MLDLVIKNANIVDGSGAPAFKGDVGIKDGKIAAVGKVDEPAKETVDAAGRTVAPGFIDVHTHYDAQAFWDPTLSPSCFHGVTTVFGGFCGFSIAPLSKEAAPYLLRMLSRVEGMPVASLEQGVPWSWSSFAEYLSLLDGRMGLNCGFMAGHSAIRCVTMGPDRGRSEESTPEDLEKMKALLAKSLSEGAMGFSSTISPTHNDDDGQPVPSRAATKRELIELAGVCRDYEGTCLELLPGVGAFPEETANLMVEMSVAAQRPLNWNTLSADSPAMVSHQLAISDLARKHGGDIVALASAQHATVRINLYSGFVFDAFEGPWAELFQLPIEGRIEFLKDPANRKRLDAVRERPNLGQIGRFLDWDSYTIDAVFDPANKPYEGRTVSEVAKERGQASFDAMLDIAIKDGLRTSFMHITPDTDQALWDKRGKLWADDRTVIGGSDAGAHLDMIDSFAITTQVLSKGVREYGVIGLEQAVRQLTYVPAQMFGLRERGLLKPGYHADIVVFDPATIARGATYMRRDLPADEPRVYADATGVDHVFVNGVQIVRDGEHTGALPGKVFRSGVDTANPRLPVHSGLAA